MATEQFVENFIKSFPELKYEIKEYRCCGSNCANNSDAVPIEHIEKHCLSRNRVRQVIERYYNLGCNCNGGDCGTCLVIAHIKDLKKELGLEGEE